MGLPINGVAYAAIFIVIVLLVARFTSQLMWRWFLLDTLREVAPPRSAARTSATSSTGSRPACAEKKNLTPTSTGGPLRLSAASGWLCRLSPASPASRRTFTHRAQVLHGRVPCREAPG